MATASKVLLRTGIYQPPQGELRVTGRRLRHYADQFARMRALGIKIPVAWGHQPDANPADANQRASQQYYLGAYNAGYLDDLSIDAHGQLAGKPNCPGCEVDPKTGDLVSWVRLADGREVKTAIGEVSVAIGNWTDGQGRQWRDVIKHVALTPLPVMTGQGGFTAALATDSTGDGNTVYYLSTNSLRCELSTAEDDDMPFPPKKDEDEAVAGAAAKGAAEGEEDAAETETPPPPPPETPSVTPPAAGDAGAEMAAAVLALKAFGLHLPSDTTLANLAERIRVAGHGKLSGEGGADEDDEDDECDEGEGVTYSGEEGQTQEEERPVMMSLATVTDPVARKSLAREQEQHKKRQLKLIDKLVKKGMPVYRAAEFREKLTNYTLSLTEDGEIAPADVDKELSTWTEALANSNFGSDLLGKAKRQRRPEAEGDAQNRKKQEEAGDELASRATMRK